MRGKTKIGTTVMLLTLTLSMLAVLSVSPAQATATATLRAPTIINPLLGPGGVFTADLLVSAVGATSGNPRMYGYDLTLNYNPNIITATNVGVPRVAGGPNFPFSSFEINTTAGSVHIRAFTANTTTNDLPYRAPLISTDNVLLVGFVTFTVDHRGVTPLALNSVTLYDSFMNPITPVNVINGVFDNRFQGVLEAPIYQNLTLLPETGLGEGLFSVDVSVANVTHLWGFEFSITWDPNVITMYDWAPTSVLNLMAPSTIDVGFAKLSAHSFFGDPNGLTAGSTLTSVARLFFFVNQKGWSTLHLGDEVLATTTGNTLVPEIHDGAVATVDVADLIGRAAWPDVHKFVQSKEPTAIDVLHARVGMNATGASVMVQVVFTVYDRGFGIVLGTIKTTPVLMAPLADTTVTANFDTNAWGTAPYKVSIFAQAWADVNGDGVMDFAGQVIQPINIQVRP